MNQPNVRASPRDHPDPRALAAGQPADVPMWAKVAAWAVPVAALPSAIWRTIDAIDAQLAGGHACPLSLPTQLAETTYVISMSVLQVGFALLTVGLIRSWGESFPRWIPMLGGRRVPVGLGVAAGISGAAAVTYLVLYSVFADGVPTADLPAGCQPPGWDVGVFYAPLLLWPPLLLTVTWHYWRRRRS